MCFYYRGRESRRREVRKLVEPGRRRELGEVLEIGEVGEEL